MTDLDAIRNTWLTNCGHCDFGMVINCTCPSGDPRNIIAQLAGELEQQAAELSQLRAIAEAATAFVDTYDRVAAGTWPTHRTLDQTVTDHNALTNARNTLTHTVHTWRRHQLRPQGDGWTPGTLQDTTGRTLDWKRTQDNQP